MLGPTHVDWPLLKSLPDHHRNRRVPTHPIAVCKLVQFVNAILISPPRRLHPLALTLLGRRVHSRLVVGRRGVNFFSDFASRYEFTIGVQLFWYQVDSMLYNFSYYSTSGSA